MSQCGEREAEESHADFFSLQKVFKYTSTCESPNQTARTVLITGSRNKHLTRQSLQWCI